jgi:hypothetical protein
MMSLQNESRYHGVIRSGRKFLRSSIYFRWYLLTRQRGPPLGGEILYLNDHEVCFDSMSDVLSVSQDQQKKIIEDEQQVERPGNRRE